MLAALAVMAVAAVALTAVAAVPEAQAEGTTIDVSSETGLSDMTGGNTYSLTRAVTIHDTITVASGSTATLDLNGHTLSVAGGFISVQGTLTITDSGSTGTLIYSGTTYSALISVESGGSLTVKDGTITSFSGSVNPIWINSGTVNIDGGRVTSNGVDTSAVRMSSGEFNMSGGSIVSGTGSAIGLSVSEGTVNITGGRITGSSTAVSVADGTVTIGGAKLSSSSADTISIAGGTVALDGTTVTQSSSSYYAVAFTDGTLSLGKDTSITGGKGLQIPEDKTVTLTGVIEEIEVMPEGYTYGSSSVAITSASLQYAADSASNFSYAGSAVAGFYASTEGVVYIGDGYTVTFDPDNGDAVTKQIVVEGRTAVQTADPVRSGYKFTGWYADGASESYDFNDAVTSDLTLVAGWETAKTYVVSYDPNGMEGDAVKQSVVVGQGFTTIKNPFDTGYEFIGWSTNPEATTAEYAAEESVDDPEIEAGETLTLYAVWGDALYPIVIEFLSNGGSGETFYMAVDVGESLTMPSTDFTRSGYELAGWATESGGAAVFSAGQTVTYDEIVEVSSSTDLTLYAVWEKSPTVIIDPSMDDRRGTTVTTTSGSDTDSTKILAVAAAAAAAAVMAAFIALGLRKD